MQHCHDLWSAWLYKPRSDRAQHILTSQYDSAGDWSAYSICDRMEAQTCPLAGHVLLQELRFAADCLVLEPKNYHAWAHRQAVLLAAAAATGATTVAGLPAAPAHEAAPAEPPSADSTPGHSGNSGGNGCGGGGCGDWWAAELDYVESCIGADVRDNSAWAQRFFLLRSRYAIAVEAAALQMSVRRRCSTQRVLTMATTYMMTGLWSVGCRLVQLSVQLRLQPSLVRG